MKRALLGAVLIASLAACTYVSEPAVPGQGYAQAPYGTTAYVQQPYGSTGYVQQQPYGTTGYVQQPYGTTGYVAAPAPAPTTGYRDGSYERERQAYEYGRREGAAQGWR
jgi:hypothetical protein